MANGLKHAVKINSIIYNSPVDGTSHSTWTYMVFLKGTAHFSAQTMFYVRQTVTTYLYRDSSKNYLHKVYSEVFIPQFILSWVLHVFNSSRNFAVASRILQMCSQKLTI